MQPLTKRIAQVILFVWCQPDIILGTSDCLIALEAD